MLARTVVLVMRFSQSSFRGEFRIRLSISSELVLTLVLGTDFRFAGILGTWYTFWNQLSWVSIKLKLEGKHFIS